MNIKSAVLPVSLVALFGFCSTAQSTINQLTNNGTSDTLPQVNGNAVVWQGQVNGFSEIFLHNLTSGTTIQISTSNAPPNVTVVNEISPQTDGNYVTWLGNHFNGSINYYDINTGGPAVIVSGGTGQQINSAPQIASGRIVWTRNSIGTRANPGDIYMFDINAGGSAINISSNAFDDTSPLINDTTVIWNQTDEMGTAADPSDDVTTLMTYDIASGTVNPAAANYIWPESPQIDGSLSVYSQHDGTDREIFLKEAQMPVQQLTNNAIEDTYPRVSGTAIVWVGGKGNAAEIYSFTPILDADGDGVPDAIDNCINVANPDQRDSNNDGYGNICDGDFNGDGYTNTTDLALFKMAFGTVNPNPDTDFNGDGVINTTDLALFKMAFGQPPGPSAGMP